MYSATSTGGGLCIAFPDVCKVPVPSGPIPIPYPNVAQTARQRRTAQKSTIPNQRLSKSTRSQRSSGDEVGTAFPVKVPADINPAKVAGEIVQLKSMLTQLHARLLNTESDDPGEWERILQDYAVAAGALYVTRTVVPSQTKVLTMG